MHGGEKGTVALSAQEAPTLFFSQRDALSKWHKSGIRTDYSHELDLNQLSAHVSTIIQIVSAIYYSTSCSFFVNFFALV